MCQFCLSPVRLRDDVLLSWYNPCINSGAQRKWINEIGIRRIKSVRTPYSSRSTRTLSRIPITTWWVLFYAHIIRPYVYSMECDIIKHNFSYRVLIYTVNTVILCNNNATGKQDKSARTKVVHVQSFSIFNFRPIRIKNLCRILSCKLLSYTFWIWTA